MKLRKNVLVTLGILVAIGGGTSYAGSNIEPNSRRCPISTSYSESSVSRSKSEQFSHMAYSSPITSSVTHKVTLKSSLSLNAGISADMKLLLAKSSIKFEMGYTGSIETTTSIKWNVPAGGNYRLVAGKEIADVKGKVTTIDAYCNRDSRYINVKGSYRTYHTAIKE